MVSNQHVIKLALKWLEKESCNHLGIFRDIKQKVNIEEKISLGRKTAYALMGASLHPGNGLRKPLCAYFCSTHMIQRVIYCLEVQKLSRTNGESLEKFQRKCLGKSKGFQIKRHIVLLSPDWVLYIHQSS